MAFGAAMPKSTQRPFEFEGTRLLSSALHAQLVERRRPTFEHDIKNVVHGLMSGTELLTKALATSTPRITPAECLNLLQQQIVRTQATLHRMLDEVAPAATQESTFNLAELLEECEHDLRHDLQRFELATEIDNGLRVRAYRAHLKDALLYLLIGAMDSMRSGAHMRLVAGARNGKAVFELAYTPIDGKLPQVAKIREILNGGDIALATEHGAVHLTVTVPLAAPDKSGERLLIVDASRDAADSLAMLAQLAGFEAQATYDLDSALQLARTQQPTAILVDADGSIDCDTLATRVRELTANARIVAMSDGNRSCNARVDAHLRKPLDPRELRNVLGD
jgi:CheY-like chemotaxis protein